jgi:hypothetical protein
MVSMIEKLEAEKKALHPEQEKVQPPRLAALLHSSIAYWPLADMVG